MEDYMDVYDWNSKEEKWFFSEEYHIGDSTYCFKMPLDNNGEIDFVPGLIVQEKKYDDEIIGVIAMFEPEIIQNLRGLGTKMVIVSTNNKELNEHYHVYNGGYTFRYDDILGFSVEFSMLSTVSILRFPLISREHLADLGNKFIDAADRIDALPEEE